MVELIGFDKPGWSVGLIESIDEDALSGGTSVRVRHPDGMRCSYRTMRILRIIDEPIELLALAERFK